MSKQEKKNQTIGMATSIGVHALLLLIFIFATAWRAPGPPAAEFGVVVNVGFDDQGSGEIQTDKPVAEPNPQEQVAEEQPKQEEPKPVEEVKPVDKTEKEEILAAKEESPVTVKKEVEKTKEKPKEEPKKEEPKKEEPKKEEPKKEPEQLKTVYNPSDAKNSQKNDKGEKGENEGDDKDKTGNKGQPNGSLDPNGQYTGTPGGGAGGNGGFSLDMSGWAFTERPRTGSISENESGRIVFEIECDDNGEIFNIKTLERGVSPATEQILKSEIMRIALKRTKEGGIIPERSKGTVTFVIKSR